MVDAAQKYYEQLNGGKVIAVDFDNTVCLDEWPEIGPVFKDAIKVMKELINSGHYLILYTQRSDFYPICCKDLEKYYKEYGGCLYEGNKYVDIITDAIGIFYNHNIELWDINRNRTWEGLTQDNSRKLFADYFIDDHNVGMQYKIIVNKNGESCKACDWNFIDDWFVKEGLYKNKVL